MDIQNIEDKIILQIIIYRTKGGSIISVDNKMVVLYNKFLLMKYKYHINVEYCASIQSIKYMFDYTHKGGDRTLCKIQKISKLDEENSIVFDEI